LVLLLLLCVEHGKIPIELPLLYPSGNMRRETLADILGESGIPYHLVTAYRTVENPQLTHTLDAIVATTGGGGQQVGKNSCTVS